MSHSLGVYLLPFIKSDFARATIDIKFGNDRLKNRIQATVNKLIRIYERGFRGDGDAGGQHQQEPGKR